MKMQRTAPRRTQYFAPDVQPARPGFYECRGTGSQWDGVKPMRCRWNGYNWFWVDYTHRSGSDWMWRGLVAPA